MTLTKTSINDLYSKKNKPVKQISQFVCKDHLEKVWTQMQRQTLVQLKCLL